MAKLTTDLTPMKVVNISARDIEVKYDGRSYGVLEAGETGIYGGPAARLATKNIINSKIIDDNAGKEVLPLNDVNLREELQEKILFEAEISIKDEEVDKSVAPVDMTYQELVSYASELGITYKKKGTKRADLVRLVTEHLEGE